MGARRRVGCRCSRPERPTQTPNIKRTHGDRAGNGKLDPYIPAGKHAHSDARASSMPVPAGNKVVHGFVPATRERS
ncbi:hypothetical protein GCM10025762_18260 [Haloechinothrix salitolerans]